MTLWSDHIRNLHVTVLEHNRAHATALVEVRVEPKLGAPFRSTEIQVGLYCEGQEVAVGLFDGSGRWSVKVENLPRNANDLIFEAQARLSLGKARSRRRRQYHINQDGRVFSHEASGLPPIPTPDPQLQFVLPEMVKVRTGSGWMGKGAVSHRVRISRPLLFSAVPVTQALYQVVMGINPSNFPNPRRPVEQVSFWDALQFCNKLSELEGLTAPYRLFKEKDKQCVEWVRSSGGYRLPTEAEWEYAARAGREQSFAGSDRIDEVGWCQQNARGHTRIVAQKFKNEWGLYDMCGNVWEWCFDEWDESAYDWRKGEIHVDPVVVHSNSATRRVRRGGCWVTFAHSCTVHHRFWGSVNQKTDETGFRIVRTL